MMHESLGGSWVERVLGGGLSEGSYRRGFGDVFRQAERDGNHETLGMGALTAILSGSP